MANGRIGMRDIKEVFRLDEMGFAKLKIHQITGLSRDTITTYLLAGKNANITFSNICNLSTDEIYSKLFPRANGLYDKFKIQPDWKYIHSEMQKKNVTVQLLWEEFIAINPDGIGYSRFCSLYRDYLQKTKLTMRQNHKLGEKAFVDYAGHTIPIINQETGEVKQA